MPLNAPETVYQLLQLIALALPAIAIYLQVLVQVHQTEETAEIDGQVPKFTDGQNIRHPDKEPNVIEAMPSFVTSAPTKRSFSFALQSLMLFACALLPLLFRIVVDSEFLVLLSLIFISVGVVGFVCSLGLLLLFSVSEMAEEEFQTT